MHFKMYHACITVLDIERSVAFYREALGLEPVREINAADGSSKIVFLSHRTESAQGASQQTESAQGASQQTESAQGASQQTEPVLLELTWYRDKKEPYNLGDNETHIGFRTDDYEKAYKKHSEMGCVCFENKKMGIYFIEDPDGYWMEIVPVR